MGVFDKGVDPAELERFKREVKSQIDNLTQEIKLKASDSEETARAAAERALVIEKKIKAVDTEVTNALGVLEGCVTEAKNELAKIKDINNTFASSEELANTALKNGQAASAQILVLKQSATTACDEITAGFAVVKAALLEAEKLPEHIESIKNILKESVTTDNDIKSLLSHALKKKSDIDELHKKIIGSNIASADGTTERVDGLIDVLESSYIDIENRVEFLNNDLQLAITSITEKHEKKISEEKVAFDDLVKKSSDQYKAVNDQLMGLMPGAMAAGLSAAYENKKNEEIKSLEKYELAFKVAIALMVAVSVIPFGVDAYQLAKQNADLVQVIKNTPSLMLSILPLYFPVLWFAYSSSKKLNLSKRLIEEYTHKAVLGGTFSGLSNQIESLPRDSLVRDELRTKLLFNLLQVSSENPGKLITDYNKSDHPLMDALENSAKLSGSIETLSKLPGFSALAKKLAARTEEFISNETKKVVDGLTAQNELEKPIEKSTTPVAPTTVA